jgi:hypothetical protein
MGGWQSAEMVRRHAHLAADHLAPFAESFECLERADFKIYGTFTAQSKKSGSWRDP